MNGYFYSISGYIFSMKEVIFGVKPDFEATDCKKDFNKILFVVMINQQGLSDNNP